MSTPNPLIELAATSDAALAASDAELEIVGGRDSTRRKESIGGENEDLSGPSPSYEIWDDGDMEEGGGMEEEEDEEEAIEFVENPVGRAVVASEGGTGGEKKVEKVKVEEKEKERVARRQIARTLKGHSDGVCAVAVMDDGRIVSGSDDRTVKVWNDGACEITLQGHSDWVWCVACWGSKVISGSEDNTVKVWDLAKGGENTHTFKGHTNGVRSVAVTEDGSRVISGSGDKTVMIWSLASGELERTLKGHTEIVDCVAVLGDGRVVSGGNDKTIRVWNIETGESLKTLKNDKWVYAVAETEDGKIVSGDYGGKVKVWDIEKETCVATFEGHTNAVRSVAVWGKLVVSGSWDTTVSERSEKGHHSRHTHN